jgi:hypothetical protein
MELTETDLSAAMRCASELLDRRRLQGVPIPAWLSEHRQRMRIMAAACGPQKDGREPQLEEMIDTREVAAMLNRSTRHVRRIASNLGGVRRGRDWIFDRSTVEDHIAGGRQR